MDNGARLINHLLLLVGTTTSGARSMASSCGTIIKEMFVLINRFLAGLIALIKVAACSIDSTMIQENSNIDDHRRKDLPMVACPVMGRFQSRLTIYTT